MQYQARYATFGGGAVTPAVKVLLIVNISVFILQTFVDYRLVYFFGLVPQLVWQDLYLWQLFTYLLRDPLVSAFLRLSGFLSAGVA